MKQLERCSAILAVLLLTPALEAMPRKEKSSAASSVEYHGSLIDLAGSDNFRVVIPGILFRANTLKPETLSYYITKHGIKNVICLRGEHPEKEWWQNEAYVCERQKVTLHGLRLKAHSYTSPDHLRELLGFFETPGPLLIHCLSGVDRTGLALGLWLLEEAGVSRHKACKQLSFFRYGHLGSRYPQMKSCLKLWTALSDRFDRAHALQEYEANYGMCKLAEVAKLKDGNKKLKFATGYVDQIVYNLERGWYMPRTKPSPYAKASEDRPLAPQASSSQQSAPQPSSSQPGAPAASSSARQVRL